MLWCRDGRLFRNVHPEANVVMGGRGDVVGKPKKQSHEPDGKLDIFTYTYIYYSRGTNAIARHGAGVLRI